MNYRITALKRDDFVPLFDMDDAELAERGATRIERN